MMNNNMYKTTTPCCIGIDIGTTTISTVVLDVENGETFDVFTVPNASNIPSEHPWEKMQDAEQITECVSEILNSLLERYSAVRAIGFTGQMHGILYTDKEGNAVSPLYTWQDERAGIGELSPCQILCDRTGHKVPSGYGLATHFANMINDRVPENAVKLCTIMDHAVMKLTGRTTPMMHTSNAASLGLYRAAESCFDMDAVCRAGIDPSILPEITSQCKAVGTWRGIPVIVAIGDNQAAFIGSVRSHENSALANFGTGSQISVMSKTIVDTQANTSVEYRPFNETSCLASGSALCGGRAYALMERFFRDYVKACGMADAEQYEVMNRLAEEAIANDRFLHIRTTFCGTRSDPSLLGSIWGISEQLLTPGAMIAGTLWGMANELHEMFLQMPHDNIDTLIISGNAVRKNPALQKMLKQVFGMKVYIPKHNEEAAFGAAILSAITAGVADREKVGACISYDVV